MAVVDASKRFIFVDVGCQGRISDAGVFRDCKINSMMEEGTLNLPSPIPLPGRRVNLPYLFVGDKAFPLKENLMTPYVGTHPRGSQKRIYNYRLSRARITVEHTFGIMASVFRVLKKPMLLQPHKAQIVLMAIAHLHNFLREKSELYHTLRPNETEEYTRSWLPLRPMATRNIITPKEIRHELSDYFMKEGKLQWQNKYC